MPLLDNAAIVTIMHNTLNYVDTRLTDHGKRVSYMVYRMLAHQAKYTGTQLRDITLLAMLHDIGAYKTEEIDQMVRFETEEVWDHSIWGYLFMMHFSPFQAMAPVILYHHTPYEKILDIDSQVQEIAQIINIADRADTYTLENHISREGLYAFLAAERGKQYRSDVVDLFMAAHPEPVTMAEISADQGYYQALHGIPFDDAAIWALLTMNVLAIDFRSDNTAAHTITTSACSQAIATHMQLEADTVEKITTGAMLHDLGKTGIPVEILEYPGRLSPQAMKIMKRHVVMTEAILAGNVDDTLLRIAVRHHEKLNGDGYPRGLTAKELTMPERIVAVADIVSALYETRSYKKGYEKQEILAIIDRMVSDQMIDPTIVDVIHTHFEAITGHIEATREPILQHYEALQQEFDMLKNRYDPASEKDLTSGGFHDDGYRHLLKD